LKEWLRLDSQFCRFQNYDLTYTFFNKLPSWGRRKPDGYFAHDYWDRDFDLCLYVAAGGLLVVLFHSLVQLVLFLKLVFHPLIGRGVVRMENLKIPCSEPDLSPSFQGVAKNSRQLRSTSSNCHSEIRTITNYSCASSYDASVPLSTEIKMIPSLYVTFSFQGSSWRFLLENYFTLKSN